MEEVTFALIKHHVAKSHVLQEAVFGQILHRGFVIRHMQARELTRAEITLLYYEHLERPYFPSLALSVTGMVIPMVLSGPDVIRRWRIELGATDPSKSAANSIRGMFGNKNLMAENVAHGSDSEQAARREISAIFPDLGWYEIRR